MTLRLPFLLILLLLTFRSNAQPGNASSIPENDFLYSYKINYLNQETGLTLSKESNLLLYDTLVNWLGTPYKYAGNCDRGIDCSGFVNVLCDRVYGKKLGARNSAEIYSLINKITRDDLKEGDLVFFNTRKRRISHIGLYLGDNKFVHSSTSRGVIISDLNEEYYKRRFAGAGRLRENLAEAEENN
jgi:lipoprotein Spr